jgi:acetyl-CoA acetyltransferase
MTRSVIVSAVRTPVGKYGAGLRSQSAVDLGAVVIREAVARAAIRPRDVEWVVMGHVLQAGAGQITARQATVAAGIPPEAPAITINNVCLSIAHPRGRRSRCVPAVRSLGGDASRAWDGSRDSWPRALALP